MPHTNPSFASGKHPSRAAYIAGALCLLLTVGLTWMVRLTIRKWETASFEALASAAYRNLATSVEYELNAIRAIQGLFHTAGELTEAQWRQFLPSLNWRRNYPNLLSVGYADWVPGNGEIPPKCLIRLIDSRLAADQQPVGTDLARTPDQLAALLKAADSSIPCATLVATLQLARSNETAKGSLLFLPIYQRGTVPKQHAQRRAELRGFAFTTLVAVNEYRNLLTSQTNQVVRIQIDDLPEGSPGVKPAGNRPTPVVRRADGIMEQTLITPGIGRVWRFSFTSLPGFPGDSSRHFPWAVAVVGGLTTLLLFTWLHSQGRSQVKIAEWNERISRMNQDLEQRIAARTSELTQANQQLQSEVVIRTGSQEMLSQLEELYRRCIGVANAVPYSRDYRTETFTFMGEGIQAITGYTAAEMTPQLWEKLVEASELQGELAGLEVDEAVRLARAGHFKYWRDDCRIRTRSGEARWVADASIEVMGPDGLPIGSMGILQDITDRKRAEEKLLRSLQLEKELGEMKTNFVSTVSHEFRTPLGIIISSAQILERYHDRLSPEARREHLVSISQAVTTMARMMEDVLVLSRADAGRLQYQSKELDLVDFCQTIIDESLASTARRCPIHLEAGPGELGEARGDDTLIRHILSNLVSNAVKYSAPGSPVRVRAWRQGADAVLQVQDKGRGIPAAEKDRIFVAFHRAANTEGVPGTGLGLVIVKRCVDLHRGRIHYQSQEGKGTEFTVWLPLFEPPSPAA